MLILEKTQKIKIQTWEIYEEQEGGYQYKELNNQEVQ